MWVVFLGRIGIRSFISLPKTHGWGDYGGGVRGVPVLKDGFLECIDVDCATFPNVAGDQPFDGFYTYLSSAVAVGERHRAKTVVYSPVVQELPGGVCGL